MIGQDEVMMTSPDDETPRGTPCREVAELVTEYLDGALPAGASRDFEDHLNECQGCAIHVGQIMTTIAAASQLTNEPLSASLRRSLIDVFRQSHAAEDDWP